MKSITVSLLVVLSALLLWNGACGERDMPTKLPGEENPAPEPEPTPSPEPDGTTVAGKVRTSSGEPLAGVAVSDGVSVTLTDETGAYRLQSDKSKGFVFVSVPGNYTVPLKGSRPQLHCNLTLPANELEIHNFELIPADNSSYAVLIHSDQHLANRTEDVSQFNSRVIPDAAATISRQKSLGRAVYSISLGDISWEQFWESRNFNLNDAVECFDKFGCPVFHTIGNHDNNPYVSGDWLSSSIFRMNVAPTYYSFNIGEVHYVVLDNVIYNNPGASYGEMGDRSYDRAVSSDQLEWLKADLDIVKDKSAPLVICGHVPFMSNPSLSGQETVTGRNLLNMEEIEHIIAPFSNVTIFSGHYHRNFTVDSPFLKGVREYNVASLSATLWWTGKSGYAGNHICTDGTPGGYGILEVNGRDIKYRYKGLGMADDYQFRVYDLNTVIIDKDCVTNSKYKDKVTEYAGVYSKPNNNNEILVNVFNWGPGWKIEVTEEGTPLNTTRVKAKDPLHILSYECMRLSHGAIPTSTSTLMTQNSIHFFKARASKADTSVTVKVTDDSGRVYSQTIARPKQFCVSML